MSLSSAPPLKVAVLDLYDGEPNQGMRALRELLSEHDGRFYGQKILFQIFETRLKGEIPGLDYDVYISSGGPGSPYDGTGKAWEAAYFDWLDALWNHNERRSPAYEQGDRKHVLFICHSFQIMCRFFEVAAVVERRSQSFGIFPVHPTPAGAQDPLFRGLPDPFYAADFRHWQVVRPDSSKLEDLGATLLAREKVRPHVELERAVMGIRVSPELVGVQFHPEADPPGMRIHFSRPERSALVIRRHGQEKYDRIMHRLEDPNYLKRTHDAVLPNFLQEAMRTLRPESVPDVRDG